MRCLSFGFGLCFAGACRIFRDQSSVFVQRSSRANPALAVHIPTPKFLHDSTYLHDHAHTVRRVPGEGFVTAAAKALPVPRARHLSKRCLYRSPFCFARAFVVDERAVQVEDNRLNSPLQHGYALGILATLTKPCAPFVEPTAKTTAADYRAAAPACLRRMHLGRVGH